MSFRDFYFFKTFSGKSFIIAFVLFCFSHSLFSQSASPQQQAKIDSLMTYVRTQMSEGKVPDQKYIDSCNAVIRNMNVKAEVKDSAGKIVADSTREITKQVFAGSGLTVPEGKTWRVKRVFVNNGGSANVLVTSVKFEKIFAAGEKVYAPTWSAEAELLNGDTTSFAYIFTILETDIKK
jgi:hypothetical protein